MCARTSACGGGAGCELLGNPRVIFADEPTSGLDAFQVLPSCVRARVRAGVREDLYRFTRTQGSRVHDVGAARHRSAHMYKCPHTGSHTQTSSYFSLIDPSVCVQAERMMSVLRGIAAQGCTVIVTIHQPSSKV